MGAVNLGGITASLKILKGEELIKYVKTRLVMTMPTEQSTTDFYSFNNL